MLQVIWAKFRAIRTESTNRRVYEGSSRVSLTKLSRERFRLDPRRRRRPRYGRQSPGCFIDQTLACRLCPQEALHRGGSRGTACWAVTKCDKRRRETGRRRARRKFRNLLFTRWGLINARRTTCNCCFCPSCVRDRRQHAHVRTSCIRKT